MRLDHKTIIITGASSGIGAAAAKLFAAQGANVVLGARRAHLLDELAKEISGKGGQAVVAAGDVADEVYAERLVELAIAHFGGLDGAFNNAGTMGDLSTICAMHSNNWHEVIATNLTGAFYCSKHQVPAMRTRGRGSIVFTSSFVGHTSAGMMGMGAYATSKAGLIGLTQALAQENGRYGIRVNALLPGGTKTAMAGEEGEVHEYVAGLHALKRMAEPEEIAEVASFLLSESSKFVTGSAILADGGISIQLGSAA